MLRIANGPLYTSGGEAVVVFAGFPKASSSRHTLSTHFLFTTLFFLSFTLFFFWTCRT